MNELNRQFVIYLVDDEPSICDAVGHTLGELACEVVAFTRAEECLAAIREKKCNLVITDLNMPGMNGMELLQAVKKIKPFLPVLLVTGFGEIPVAVKAIKAGAFDFIEKPFDDQKFLPLVRAALEQNANYEMARPQVVTLTGTEKRILQLIVDGKSNKEMASVLGCSVRTVENHRYRIMRKMNIDSTAGLVKAAITLGMAS
jgi:two-component system, LuxR family, response regulator FixJ